MSPFLLKRWEFLTKSDYLSNAAKLMLISSVLLFLTNLFSWIDMYTLSFSEITGKLSTYSFYGVFVLSLLAFNGAGIAYKHSRETGKKRITTYFKILVLFAFVARFLKSFIENLVLKADSVSAVRVSGGLFMSVFNTVSSYGFLLTMVALWLLIRDSNFKKLVPFEALAFITGLLYNVYKVFNFAVSKYDINIFGAMFSDIFSQKSILNILCLLHFATDIIMCAIAIAFYDKETIKEQAEKEKINAKAIISKRIYTSDCVGLDCLEDTYFTETEKSQEEVN